jgi:hypothetical protein
MLEPGRDTDHVSRDEALAVRCFPGHNFARRDSNANEEPQSVLAQHGLIEPSERGRDFAGRAHGPKCVVLMCHWTAEHGDKASPMNFSIVPPCRRSTAETAAK